MSRQFERFNKWGLEFKNRWAMAPMGFIHAEDGGISKEQRAYLVERAKGGFGIVYPSAHTVSDRYELEGTGNFLCNYSHAMRLAEAVEEIHRFGSIFAVQLTPGYGRVNVGVPGHTEHVSASDNTIYYYPDHKCRPLTLEEIHTLVEQMGNAAALAKQAGVDIIEIHAYGGYMIDQFMSKLWNRREDEYGGSLENRLRFFRECYQAVREAVGPEYPISVKYTPQHGIPGGRTFEDEGIEIARILDQMDLAYIHLDDGCYERWNLAIPAAYEKAGSQIYVAKRLREAGIKKPFMLQGKLNDPALAEELIEAGLADFIALGKQSLADPYFPAKVRDGRLDEVDYCMACGECLNGGMLHTHPLGCALNPRTTHELEYERKPAVKPMRLLVIGGGPGGLYAAKMAAELGHEVELWEKETILGGNAIPAGAPAFKADTRRFIRNLIAQVYKAGVKVRLFCEATRDKVDAWHPDAVILAAGANPLMPPIPGMDMPHVFTAVDVLTEKAEPGKTVVILGGGDVGCETALHLDQQGRQVIVAEMLDDILKAPMAMNSHKGILDLLNQSGITFLTETKITKIGEDHVTIERNGAVSEIPCDSVVIAAGFRPEKGLMDSLRDTDYPVFPIGDCRQPRKFWFAIHEGFQVVRQLEELIES